MSKDLVSLKKLVSIRSGTSNHSGIERVQNQIQKALRRLGFQCQRYANPLGQHQSASLLVGSKGTKRPEVTLVIHADTVFEKSVTRGKKGRLYGPGILDDKGGIVTVLKGLELFFSGNRPQFGIQVLSTPSEETGSPGFHSLFRKLTRHTKVLLGFEPSLPSGSIIHSRRGGKWYHAKVLGREAHAGRDFEYGINAAEQLSKQINELVKLSRPKKHITVSVGSFQGGRGKFNIVCGQAEAKIDTRFPDKKSGEKLHRNMARILNKSFVSSAIDHRRAVTHFEIVDDCPAFSATKASMVAARKYCSILTGLEGRPRKAEAGYGSSDCNYIAQPSMIILDGLGPVGGGMHTTEEWVDPSTIETRARALCQFLESL